MRRGAPVRRAVTSAPLAAESTEPSGGSLGAEGPLMAWVRILAVHKRGLNVLRAHLERDMTLPRFDLLANLCRSDGQTLASLSRHMLVTAGNLTGLVDRAARDGLVERRADPADRRAWRVHVTAKGQRVFRDAERRHAARLKRAFSALTPEEIQTLVGLLDKLRTELRDTEPPVSARTSLPRRSPPRRPRKKSDS